MYWATDGNKITPLKVILTSFLCLLKKELISNKPSLTLGVEQWNKDHR